MAGAAGLEPVTSAVTGQRSNQLSYAPAKGKRNLKELTAERQVFVGEVFKTTARPVAKFGSPTKKTERGFPFHAAAASARAATLTGRRIQMTRSFAPTLGPGGMAEMASSNLQNSMTFWVCGVKQNFVMPPAQGKNENNLTV